MKQVFADTHVHIYPFYDCAEVFSTAIDSINAVAKSGSGDFDRAILLTERHDCHFFKALSGGSVDVEGFTIEPLGGAARVARISDSAELFIFPGRQIVSKEKIEVLALTSDVDIVDGMPIEELLHELVQSDAVPVLNWSPGKWMFSRGAIVEGIVSSAGERGNTQDFLLGDVAMRPRMTPLPRILRLGTGCGMRLVAGSDPLPLAGEECRVGSYISSFSGNLNAETCVSDMRELLLNAEVSLRGSRNSIVVSALRFLKNNISKK